MSEKVWKIFSRCNEKKVVQNVPNLSLTLVVVPAWPARPVELVELLQQVRVPQAQAQVLLLPHPAHGTHQRHAHCSTEYTQKITNISTQGSKNIKQYCGFGFESGSVCFWVSWIRIWIYKSEVWILIKHQAKIIRKPWFLQFCDIFLTFYLWKMM
jgi:hypothetical protein